MGVGACAGGRDFTIIRQHSGRSRSYNEVKVENRDGLTLTTRKSLYVGEFEGRRRNVFICCGQSGILSEVRTFLSLKEITSLRDR